MPGNVITMSKGQLTVPDDPIIPFIEGDGTGPDIWRASVRVFDAAVEKAYGGKRKVAWKIGKLPTVQADPVTLRQVMVNLLCNALKYSSKRPESRVEVGFKDGRQETTFFVRDNGVGFDPRYASKLFGVFQRLHSATDFEGTGIGLAIVRRIIARHGGKTWAEAVPEEGATFYFSIPKVKAVKARPPGD